MEELDDWTDLILKILCYITNWENYKTFILILTLFQWLISVVFILVISFTIIIAIERNE